MLHNILEDGKMLHFKNTNILQLESAWIAFLHVIDWNDCVDCLLCL